MEVTVKATEKKEKLKENLRGRFEEVDEESGEIIVDTEEPEKLGRVPGIEEYTVNNETREGLKGSPVDEQAYARIESKEDAAKAYLATIMGYDLRILNSGRDWDYRNLKLYNPDIKHLKFDEPKEFLKIEKSLFKSEKTEKIELELEDEEVDTVYREMLV